MKTAFITGVTGQDGAYLSELLLKKGYKVFGGVRRLSSKNLWRLDELNLLGSDKFSLVDFDLTDPMNALRVIDSIKPDEVYIWVRKVLLVFPLNSHMLQLKLLD